MASPFFAYAGILVISALITSLYWKVLAEMARDWWIEPAWSQGMLLPPLALYIAWLRRKDVWGRPAKPELRGLALSLFASLMFIFGNLSSEFFMMRMSFVVLLCGMIWTFWGIGRLRALGFPLILLATMVPLPSLIYNSLAAPLQLFASDIATRIAQAAGVSIFRDGNIIQLAGVSLGVAEAPGNS